MQQEAIAREVVEGYRPSPQQRRVWSLLRRDESHVNEAMPYRAVCAIDIEGELDVSVLRASLSDVVERQEVLRTTFRSVRGMSFPLQVVEDAREVSLEEEDLSGVYESERERIIEERFSAELRRPFDFERGPLLGLSLLRLTPHRRVLFVTLPSLCADTRTLTILAREIALSYAARTRGERLQDEPVRYVQYSEWQNEMVEGEEGEEDRQRRREELASYTPPRLPFERKADDARPFSPRLLTYELDLSLAAKIEGLAAGRRTTTAAFLFACWQTLLRRLTQEGSKIIVDYVFDGRRFEDLRDVVGLLSKFLPVACRCEGADKFGEILKRASREIDEAAQWQDYFIREHDDALGRPDSPAFAFEYEERNAAHNAPGLTFRVREQYACTERYDLKLHCVSHDGGLLLELHYDSARYDQATATRLLEQLRTLTHSAADNTDAPVGELEVIGEAERKQLLVGWNDTRVDYGPAQLLHTLFERQAARTPDTVAVTFDGARLSYSELDTRANQLARHLHALGVGPESRVGVCVERSIEMVVALLGTLKAGAAYVPLDPEYPSERIAFMLEDSEVSVLLTQSSLLDALPQHAAHVVSLDADWPLVSKYSIDAPALEVSAEHPAYVIYTSGSTGRPKGVVITHRAISNHMLWMSDEMPLTADDRVMQKTPLSFDASVWEFYAPLLSGARLVMAPPGVHRDSAALVKLMRDESVTVVQVVPSMLRLLVEEEEMSSCERLRRVCVGGEALSIELVRRFKERLGAELYNLYGPTEATIDASAWRADESGRVTIGRPVANARMYVVDDNLNPAPTGVAGELLIGGEGLARGYLSRPELTAEKFIPDPFGERGGERLYRTGDLVRYTLDGELEYLGRIDHQVKVRGFRIELGEIESALESVEWVKQAVVVAREEESGEKRLVAYVVGEGEQGAAVNELRAQLRERLPEYMTPSAFVFLNEFPLTPNGKVDRKALPEPEQKGGEGEAGYVAPRTPTEEMLAGMFAAVLGVERVGVNDNFFELGGHSLLATQAVARARKAFGVELALNALFEWPTAGGLAGKVEEALREGAGLEGRPIQKVLRDGALPLSFAQQRLWFLDQLEPCSAAYNMPAAVRLRGELDIPALERTLSEVVRRHEVLRTTFETVGEEPRQVIHGAEPIRLEVRDLSAMSEVEREAEAARLVAEDAGVPFDLSRDLMLRASLIRLGEREHVVLFTMHHIAADGWSMGVLVREVSALYEAYSKGEESPLEELSIQYADYAAWQSERLQGEALEGQLSYWKRHLSGLPTLELPNDMQRPASGTKRAAQLPLRMDEELSGRLKELSRREGATLFMTLLAGWQVLLWSLTGQRDVVVGTDVANRTSAETESLIGFFVNQLVMRTQVEEGERFSEFLGRVREVSLGAYAHQDVPFEKVVEMMRPEREGAGGRTPLFQAKLVVQSAAAGGDEGLRMEGLSLESMPVSLPSAKFDLLLTLLDSGKFLFGALEYNADIFLRATIERILVHYETILGTVVERPDATLRELGEALEEKDMQLREAEERELEATRTRKFKTTRRRVVGESQRETENSL